MHAKKLGLTMMALVHISLDKHTPERFDNFETVIKGMPQVLECLLITGQDADYQLKVIVKDMEAYQHFILSKLSVDNNIGQVQSSFVLSKNKYSTSLPIR